MTRTPQTMIRKVKSICSWVCSYEAQDVSIQIDQPVLDPMQLVWANSQGEEKKWMLAHLRHLGGDAAD